MTAKPNLRVVPPAVARKEPEPETILSLAVPALVEAESVTARLRAHVDKQRCRLAAKRGVAFIRPEHIRREFGNG